MRSLRRSSPAVAVGPGERVLAACESVDGVVLAGTRDALYLGTTRIPWEQVEAADWDNESDVFRVSPVGSWGEEKVSHSYALTAPARLLELVRERVTASVVLQRHVPVSRRRGVRVIGRRPPRGTGEIEWFLEYDEGVDPTDPAVQATCAAALAVARSDVGL